MRRLGLPALAFVLIAAGGYVGLAVAPREEFMGDVYRIMFVHVPAAWAAMAAFFASFAASVWYLIRRDPRADALAETGAEVGVVFSTLLLITGSLWGRPTWGVWWTWDPRLTSAAIMWLAYSIYLALRRLVRVPEQRAGWSAVVGVVIFVDIPIVRASVNWWSSIHQVRSTVSTLDPSILRALYLNGAAYLVLLVWFMQLRYAIARRRSGLAARAPVAG